MSQRLGMADGRCFTIHTSSKLLDNYNMNVNNIPYENNYMYRNFLQAQGLDSIRKIQALAEADKKPGTCVNACNVPLLKVPDIY